MTASTETKNYWSMKNFTPLKLHAMCDAEFADSRSQRRSISGFFIFVQDIPVFCKSKRQFLVAQSTFESEFISACHCLEETILIRYLLQFFGLQVLLPIPLYCDNQSTLRSFQAAHITEKAKFIDIKFLKMKQPYQL